jgi:hypothetical protein
VGDRGEPLELETVFQIRLGLPDRRGFDLVGEPAEHGRARAMSYDHKMVK